MVSSEGACAAYYTYRRLELVDRPVESTVERPAERAVESPSAAGVS
jgi:hypothetical protein